VLEMRHFVSNDRINLAPAKVLQEVIGQHHAVSSSRKRVGDPCFRRWQHVKLLQLDASRASEGKDAITQLTSCKRIGIVIARLGQLLGDQCNDKFQDEPLE
jgi:hypothetical protein